jgi:hypothetical protein
MESSLFMFRMRGCRTVGLNSRFGDIIAPTIPWNQPLSHESPHITLIATRLKLRGTPGTPLERSIGMIVVSPWYSIVRQEQARSRKYLSRSARDCRSLLNGLPFQGPTGTKTSKGSSVSAAIVNPSPEITSWRWRSALA